MRWEVVKEAGEAGLWLLKYTIYVILVMLIQTRIDTAPQVRGNLWKWDVGVDGKNTQSHEEQQKRQNKNRRTLRPQNCAA
jgi:hypothetical protein